MSDSSGGISGEATAIAIKAETSVVHPDSCKFTGDRVIHPGGPFAYRHIDLTDDAPLVARLFGLGQITHLLIAGPTVTVTKSSAASWDTLRRGIGAAIRENLTAGLTRTVKPVDRLARRHHHRRRSDRRCPVDRDERRMPGLLVIHCHAPGWLRDNGSPGRPAITAIVDTTDHVNGTAPFHPPGSSPSTSTSPIAIALSVNRRSHTP
jgi:hypothetical protein